MRYIDPFNLVPYLALRTIFLNIGAWIRQEHQTQDVNDWTYHDFIDNFYECPCDLYEHRNILFGGNDEMHGLT